MFRDRTTRKSVLDRDRMNKTEMVKSVKNQKVFNRYDSCVNFNDHTPKKRSSITHQLKVKLLNGEITKLQQRESLEDRHLLKALDHEETNVNSTHTKMRNDLRNVAKAVNQQTSLPVKGEQSFYSQDRYANDFRKTIQST